MNVFAMGEWGCIKVKLLPMIVSRVNVSNVYYRDVYEFWAYRRKEETRNPWREKYKTSQGQKYGGQSTKIDDQNMHLSFIRGIHC